MKPLWIPSNKRIQSSNLFRFYDKLQDDWNIAFEKYEDLWLWSVTEKEKFWTSLWDFTGVIGDKGEMVIEKSEKISLRHSYNSLQIEWFKAGSALNVLKNRKM